jgi:protease I
MRAGARVAAGLVVLAATGGCVKAEKEAAMTDLTGKRVLLVVASRNFRDEEFAEPWDLLRKNGAEVTVASSSLQPAQGMLGRVVKPDILVSASRAADYDGVVFVGGPGAREYFDDASAHTLARQAAQDGKVLGAICIAPAILANAGVLRGRQAVVFPGLENVLKAGGATLGTGAVAEDRRIITATGPEAAAAFARALARALTGP